jgi:hypothetical protein
MNVQNRCDVFVYGGTPAAIAAAVRAARQGLKVTMANHTHHLGGMMTNGLVQWDAMSSHPRTPIFHEVLDAIEQHYRQALGDGSIGHRNSRYGDGPSLVEPAVFERIVTRLVAQTSNLTLWEGWRVAQVRRRYNRIESVLCQQMAGDGSRSVEAKVFIDAGYEGDLAAFAGVPYRVGREGHDETGEPHAGRVYTKRDDPSDAHERAAARWGVRALGPNLGAIDPASPRTGDHCVQAYNLRPCLTNRLDIAVPLKSPPPGYQPEKYEGYTRRYLVRAHEDRIINGKSTFNAAILPGRNWLYPEGDWALRQRIDDHHRRFAVGLIWFLQNDESIPADRQEQFRKWHLCADEWVDNDHLPYEMYVRETRRIVGRHVLSEFDLLPESEGSPARSFDDAIAFTDWFMDSHSCDRDVTFGQPISEAYGYDGKLILTADLAPGQIPYRSLLPLGVDNLIVPVCLSATHVAWGAVRLEPCLMHLGEVAGFAAVIAVQAGRLAGTLDGEDLASQLGGLGVRTAFSTDRQVKP